MTGAFRPARRCQARALIAAVIVTAVRLIGTNLTSVFNKVGNAV